MNEQHGLIKLARSKRFWTALLGLIIIIVSAFDNPMAQKLASNLDAIVVVIGMMIGGYSVQDAVREHANGKQAANGESDKQKPA